MLAAVVSCFGLTGPRQHATANKQAKDLIKNSCQVKTEKAQFLGHLPLLN